MFRLGADKYGAYNWRDAGVEAMTYVHAAERHLRSWLDGESVDPESGETHLAHVMACCAILIDAQVVDKLTDNRPPPAPTADLIRMRTRTVAPPVGANQPDLPLGIIGPPPSELRYCRA